MKIFVLSTIVLCIFFIFLFFYYFNLYEKEVVIASETSEKLFDPIVNRQLELANKERQSDHNFTRAEDLISSYEDRNVSELLFIIESCEKFKLRKAFLVLGNRSLNNSLKMSGNESARLKNFLILYITEGLSSTSGAEREEVRQNIHRLWTPAVPALLSLLDSLEPVIQDFIRDSLILMRNSEVVNQIIIKYEDLATTTRIRKVIVDILKDMRRFEHSIINGRDCISDEKTELLFQNKIHPFFLKNNLFQNHYVLQFLDEI